MSLLLIKRLSEKENIEEIDIIQSQLDLSIIINSL